MLDNRLTSKDPEIDLLSSKGVARKNLGGGGEAPREADHWGGEKRLFAFMIF